MLLGLAIGGGAHRLREVSAAVTQWVPGGFDDAMNVAVMTVLVLLILQAIEFPFAFYQGHLLEHRYGRTVRGIVAALLWLGTLAILAGQIVAMGLVLGRFWQRTIRLWPLVVAQSANMYPVTLGLVEFIGEFFVEYDLYTAAAVMAIVPVVVIYLVLQRFIIEGIATQGIKG